MDDLFRDGGPLLLDTEDSRITLPRKEPRRCYLSSRPWAHPRDHNATLVPPVYKAELGTCEGDEPSSIRSTLVIMREITYWNREK